MKKLKSLAIIMFGATFLCFLSIMCYAQVSDSTIGATIGKPLIAAADAKWAWFSGFVTLIMLLDHYFAGNPKINGNSTFQVISRFLTGATSPNA